jgi:beta-glucosidase
VTFARGILNLLGTNAQVYYQPGCPLALRVGDTNQAMYDEARAKALDLALKVDAVVYFGGICSDLEREYMGVPFEGFFYGDRTRVELPPVQTEFLKALRATGKPLVFVNCSGSAIAMPWEAENLPAIVQAWYPGQEGGHALAEVLFGDFNPAGRLPITFYRATADLPLFTDYAMSNRTYRYFQGKPLFAFGHGLSYTQFKYGPAQLNRSQAGLDDTIHVILDVTNTGARDGDEVVQVYFRHVKSAVPQPLEALCGFQRVAVPHQKSARVDIAVPVTGLRYWDTGRKQYVVEQGDYEILVGAASDDIRAKLPLRIGGS